MGSHFVYQLSVVEMHMTAFARMLVNVIVTDFGDM